MVNEEKKAALFGRTLNILHPETAADLARKAGIDEETVRSYCDGEHAPGSEDCSKLAHALDLTEVQFGRAVVLVEEYSLVKHDRERLLHFLTAPEKEEEPAADVIKVRLLLSMILAKTSLLSSQASVLAVVLGSLGKLEQAVDLVMQDPDMREELEELTKLGARPTDDDVDTDAFVLDVAQDRGERLGKRAFELLREIHTVHALLTKHMGLLGEPRSRLWNSAVGTTQGDH